MQHGKSPDIAQQDSFKAKKNGIAKQAAVLSYMDVFIYLGVLFLICVPIVLIVKGKKKKKDGEKISMSDAMH